MSLASMAYYASPSRRGISLGIVVRTAVARAKFNIRLRVVRVTVILAGSRIHVRAKFARHPVLMQFPLDHIFLLSSL